MVRETGAVSHEKFNEASDSKEAFGSPYAEKKKQSFKEVTSNFDRLYNKRIDFDRIAAQKMSIQEKNDYLDATLRRKA